MRKSILFLLCCVFVASFSSFAQENDAKSRKGQIGITYSSFGDNDLITSRGMDGGPSYSGDGFYTFGISYLCPLNNTIDLETGIEYSKDNLIGHANLPPQSVIPTYGTSLSLVSLPVLLRVNFLKYCFINGGFLFDMDISDSNAIDSQSGVGAVFGLGLKYDFKCGITVFANPFSKMHSLVRFSSGQGYQKLMESGFRFGIMVNLK